jgi:ATP-dependent Lon protease
MTGEISLRGRVLPIGGLREKTMAAYRSGIKTIVIPDDNMPDLEEVDSVVEAAIRFVPASQIRTVLDTALTRSYGKHAEIVAAKHLQTFPELEYETDDGMDSLIQH